MASFQNIYYKRTAATAKACYMCFRPTTTVLATLNTTDFLYACDGHLTDPGFATLIEPPPSGNTDATEAKRVSDEEIRRITEEWEERQRQRKEKEKAKETDKGKDASKEPDTKKPSAPHKPSPPPPNPIPVPGSVVAKPTHLRYTLHRDVWAMRLREHKKRRQTTAVKEVAPRLPITPRSAP